MEGEKNRILWVRAVEPIDTPLMADIEKVLNLHFTVDAVPFPQIHKGIDLANKYDLVLLNDYKFPRFHEQLRHIRQLSKHAPIVVISNDSNLEPVHKMDQTGVEAYLCTKDFSNDRFLQTLFSAIESKGIDKQVAVHRTILEAVNFAAEQFLSFSEWQPNIAEVLARLGKASESERVYIFSNRVDEKKQIIALLLDEWVAEGIQPCRKPAMRIWATSAG